MKTFYELKKKTIRRTWKAGLLLLAFSGVALFVNAQQGVEKQATNANSAHAWTKSGGPGAVTLAGPVEVYEFGRHIYNMNKKGLDASSADFTLGDNQPNPFNNTTEIAYSLSESGKVRLTLLDLRGSEIAVIIDDENRMAGTHSVTVSSSGILPGVYLYKLVVEGETNDFTETKRMVISR